MGSAERALDRAARLADRTLREFGDTVRECRVGAGLSQEFLGQVVGVSGPQMSRIERGRLHTLSIPVATRLAAGLGLDLRVHAYPGGEPLRDEASAKRLGRIIAHIRRPLTYGVDVVLPPRADGPIEMRAWDLVIYGRGMRTASELEMRMRDAQAMVRRHNLKRRDDPVDRFLLLLADTKTNRRVLREHLDLFPDLPLLRASVVLGTLERGEHPPSGIVLI